MATPAFDINAPDPGAGSWGPEITATRDNLVNIMMFAAATGQRLPDWDSSFTYTTGDLTTSEMIYQPDITIKMKWVYAYSGGNLDTEKWYFDKGLGAGYELVTQGTLTHNYTTGDLVSIVAS